MISWNAAAPVQADTHAARTLRLSAMDGILSVAVYDIEVLAVVDSNPLSYGSVGVNVQFNATDGQ